jgi:leader peptidase (prepilin peptidase)/N-methyltransferase
MYDVAMTIGGWMIVALAAGVLGWIGQPVMMLLPDSADAAPDMPRYADVARKPNLAWWLAGGAAVATLIVAFVVPLYLMPAWLVMCGVGAWLAFIDWHTTLLPKRIVYALSLAVAVLVTAEAWLAADSRILWRALLAGGGAFLVFYLFWMIAGRWRPGSFGYGDVRLSFPLGMTLGSVGIGVAFYGLYTGFVLGAIAGLMMRRQGLSGAFAFGPWMVAGAVLGPVIGAIVA